MGPPGLGLRCRVGRDKIHRLAVTDLPDRHTSKDNDCRRRPSTEAAMVINNDTHQENRRIWRPPSRRRAGGVHLSITVVVDIRSGVHPPVTLGRSFDPAPPLVFVFFPFLESVSCRRPGFVCSRVCYGPRLASSLSCSTKLLPKFQWYM